MGKTVVAGNKDREPNQVVPYVVPSTSGIVLNPFVTSNTKPSTIVYTDESVAYSGIARPHGSVNHSYSCPSDSGS